MPDYVVYLVEIKQLTYTIISGCFCVIAFSLLAWNFKVLSNERRKGLYQGYR